MSIRDVSRRRRLTATIPAQLVGSAPGFLAPYVVVSSAGQSGLTDHLFLSLSLVTWLALVAGAALETTFLRYFVECGPHTETWTRRRRYFAVRSGVSALVLGGGAALAASSLTNLDEGFLVGMLVLPAVMAVNSVFNAAAYSLQKFVWPQLLGAARPTALMVAVLAAGGSSSASLIVCAMIVGELFRTAALVVVLRPRGQPLEIDSDGSRDVPSGLYRSAFLVVLASIIAGAAPVTDKVVASRLPIGAITTLELAEKLLFAPLTIVNVAVGVVLSAGWAGMLSSRTGVEAFSADYKRIQRGALLIAALLTGAICLALAVLYTVSPFADTSPLHILQSSAFLWSALFYSLGLAGAVSNSISARAVQLLGSTRYLLKSSIICFFANLVLDILGAALFGAAGIALSSTLVRFMAAAILYHGVARSVRSLP